MKRFIRCICAVLVFAIILSMPVFAETTTEPRASRFFVRHITYLYKISTTGFEVWFDVVALGQMEELGAKTIKVERSLDGENWTTMRTYEKEDYTQMIRENATGYAACVTYYGTPGYYYRALVTYYAKNSTGIGEYDTYTATMQL